MNLQSMLEREEGRRSAAYPDPLTNGDPWTIGIGHTGPEVHRGLVWDDAQIDAAFDADVQTATQACSNEFPWFDALDEVRQAVLISMCFQMGINRMSKFTNTLADVGAGNYAAAAKGMRDSLWGRQTPKRVVRLAEQMESGQWV